MAIPANEAVKSMLKVYYAKEGVQNLFFRSSPVLKSMNKLRVEGKEQRFSAMVGRGGAVSADFSKAVAKAGETSKAVEFKVTPGSVFSSYNISAPEVQASLTRQGAYMKVAGAKMFSATVGFRQVMGQSLYGSGYGELCLCSKTDQAQTSQNFDLTMPADAVIKIDVGTDLDLKATVENKTVKATFTVLKINGTTVTCKTDKQVTPLSTDWLCLSGCVNADGSPRLPVGLAGWLPTVADRKTSTWTNYIEKPFFGVDRSENPDRLAGAFHHSTSQESASKSVQKAIQLARRQGSEADLIIMNDDDFMQLSNEIETTNTFFTQTSTREKKGATVGFDKVSASFSTNYIENIWDDPYCPKGTFYVLDKQYFELWTYTNTDPTDNGIEGNNPGKQKAEDFENKGQESTPYGLIIDDYINVEPGEKTPDGPSACVSILFYGSFVVLNPSCCAVGKFNYQGL